MEDVEILYSNIFISSIPLSSKSISYQSFIKKMKASKTKKLFLLPNLPYASHQLNNHLQPHMPNLLCQSNQNQLQPHMPNLLSHTQNLWGFFKRQTSREKYPMWEVRCTGRKAAIKKKLCQREWCCSQTGQAWAHCSAWQKAVNSTLDLFTSLNLELEKWSSRYSAM